MLAKKYRFSFRKGLPAHTLITPLFNLRYAISPINQMQCAVVVSKKVNKKAIMRNKVKRKFTEALVSELKEATTAYQCVFFLKSPSQEKTVDELKKEIHNTLKKVTIV